MLQPPNFFIRIDILCFLCYTLAINSFKLYQFKTCLIAMLMKGLKVMNILVCMKQVPASSNVEIDEETGTLKRMSAQTRTNPYDLYALETALTIKEQVGGHVTVITMGPPQAEQMMRDAYCMGADDAIILSDKKFAGSDVLATSYTLSQGVSLAKKPDLILCGRQTTDGDTAQIGPALAELLAIPHAAWVSKIENITDESVQVEQIFSATKQVSKINLPCLITIEKGSCVPRLPSFILKKKTADKPIRICNFEDLPSPDLSRCGQVGSPTKVDAMFAPEVNAKRVVLNGDASQKAEEITNILLQKKIIERGEL